MIFSPRAIIIPHNGHHDALRRQISITVSISHRIKSKRKGVESISSVFNSETLMNIEAIINSARKTYIANIDDGVESSYGDNNPA